VRANKTRTYNAGFNGENISFSLKRKLGKMRNFFKNFLHQLVETVGSDVIVFFRFIQPERVINSKAALYKALSSALCQIRKQKPRFARQIKVA